MVAMAVFMPGVAWTVDQVRANTGWDLKAAAELKRTQSPREEELRILRQELDPEGIYLKE